MSRPSLRASSRAHGPTVPQNTTRPTQALSLLYCSPTSRAKTGLLPWLDFALTTLACSGWRRPGTAGTTSNSSSTKSNGPNYQPTG
eukprot:3325947-Pyramimonas_sp.AAC.1